MSEQWKPESPVPPQQPPPPRRSGARRGIAILAAMVAGSAVLLVVGGIIWAAVTDADRDEGGRVERSGTISIFDVRPGDCVNGVDDDRI